MEILKFINALRKSDEYIKYIYTRGSCYQFHLLLSKMYPGCKSYINDKKNHIITKYKEKYYDIDGVVINHDGYTKLSKEEKAMVKNWSFHKNNLILITDCPNCDEPLTFKP